MICADDVPDHPVLARFRQIHEGVFAELFAQVLRWCRAAGLVKLATVAIDGRKIAANASPRKNRSAQWLAAEAEKMDQQAADQAGGADRAGEADRARVGAILAEAREVDEVEDALFGRARGDELPAGWNGRAGRRERIRAAAARLAAAEAAEREREQAEAAARAERDAAAVVKAEAALASAAAAQQEKRAAWERAWEHATANPGAPVPTGRAPVANPVALTRLAQRLARASERLAHPATAPRPARKPRPAPAGDNKQEKDKTPRANITDPDSTIMPTWYGWVQAYNGQFAITADQLILATLASTGNPLKP